MNKQVLNFAGLAVVLFTLSGCAALYRNIEAPSVELVGVATPGIKPDMSIDLQARMRITNPNDIQLPVKGGRLELELNGLSIGEVEIIDGFTLPANGSEEVLLPARLRLGEALGIGITALGNRSTRINYRMNGYIDLGTRYLGRVPIEHAGGIALNR